MTAYLTTEAAAERLGITRFSLLQLLHADGERLAELAPGEARSARRAWRCYAGEPFTRSARYRWSSEALDPWFDEVCEWRASTSRTTDAGRSDGKSADEPDPSPSAASGRRDGSRPRSKTRSTGAAGTNLVELVARHHSR